MSDHVHVSRARSGGALALAGALLTCGLGPFGALLDSAHGIDIILVYDDTEDDAVDCCAESAQCCFNTPDPVAALTVLMQAGADHWSSIILDEHEITIRFWYTTDGFASANVDSIVDGKPATAWIRIPASQTYFLDPAPDDHSAFNIGSKFYRTLHPAEQLEALTADIPELLEVGYNGPALAVMDTDLLTVILHEMGHALGLASSLISQNVIPPCDPAGQPWFVPSPAMTGGAPIGIKSFETNGGSFDCAHLALGGIVACNDNALCESHQSLMWPGLLPNARALPSAVDILALAAAAGWEEISIPRKYPVGSGVWHDELTWIGGRVPDGDDEVGILNELAPTSIELVGTAFAGDVTVSANNQLDIVIGQADLSGGLYLIGPDARARLQVGTELDAAEITIAPGASLEVDSLAHVQTQTLANSGTIDGGGMIETGSLVNTGMIRAVGGVLEVTASDFLDLDGPSDAGTAVIEAVISDLIIAGPLSDQVRASIVVGSDRVLSLPNGFEQDWSPPGPGLFITGDPLPATVHGIARLSGYTEVEGTGILTSPVEIMSIAQTSVAADSLLIFDGMVTYNGGFHTGAGTIRPRGGTIISGATTIGPIDTFDIDGDGTSGLFVKAGAPMIIDADRVESDPVPAGVDSTISVDAALEVNTLLPWTLDGEILMNLAGGTNASVGGQRIINNGLISVRSHGALLASVHVMNGAALHTIDAASRISLENPTGNRIVEGSVTGAGMLQIAPGSNLLGTGWIQTGTEIDGLLRADDGTLVLAQPPSRINVIGTRGEESMLLIPDGWSTLNGTLRLRQGTVAGGPIINTGSTTGYGIIAAASFENSGRIAPGAIIGAGDGSQGPGRLWFTQDVTQTFDGIISMDIGGLHPDLRDGILVAGTLELEGTLQLQLTEGYIPQSGDAMIIMAWGARIGTFDKVEGTWLPGGLQWEVTYMPDHLIITAVAGCTGDVTGDGDVGLADMLELLAQWGPCAGSCTADLNDDGTVDLTDLLIVLSAWGPCP